MSASEEIKNAGSPSKWKGSLRWFLSEFIVVVSGILVALGLNAWYNSSKDTDEEQAYLIQLETELLESLKEIQRADSLSRFPERAVEKLIYAFWEEQASYPDSVKIWLLTTHSFVPMEIRTGTISALITTGDIKLIEDDSLRNAILNYDKSINREMAVFRDFAREWFDQSSKIRERYDLFTILTQTIPPNLLDTLAKNRPELPLPPSEHRKQREMITSEEMLADELLYDLLAEQLVNNLNIDRIRTSLMEETEALLERIPSGE